MIWWIALALAVTAAGGCSDATTELIRGRMVQVSAPEDAATRDARSAPPAPGSRLLCDGRACECDNGGDDDGDALVDGFDPECSGAYDDDESSFGTGAASPPLDTCRDCFWDANASADDDGCRYNAACLTGAMPTGPASAGCGGCNVTGRCVNECLELTPNGCDCFGCCEQKTSADEVVYVQFVEGCSTDDIDDELKCPRCEPRVECMNTCRTCELCGKRKRKDLPQECRGASMTTAPMNVCDDGQEVCAQNSPCGLDYYCLLGCCRAVIVE